MTIEQAIAVALEAHAGQVDKAGEPYILHPLRVMLAVRSKEAKVVAVLHDVVEDSKGIWTIERLVREHGLSPDEAWGLDGVTRRDGESYSEFIERARLTHPLSLEVKIADLNDNLDVRRLRTPFTEADAKRITKYLKALARLHLP